MKGKMSILKGTAHSYEHVNRVLKVTIFLARKEQADVEMMQVEAILHDIGRTVDEPHNETGARVAKRNSEEDRLPS